MIPVFWKVSLRGNADVSSILESFAVSNSE